MGGQSFVDYVPVPDVNPPIMELVTENRKQVVLISDDGRDDIGLQEISIVRSENLEPKIPRFTIGAPSVFIDPTPKNLNSPGFCVLRAVDCAGNEAIYTICLVFDKTSNQ
jgi:hypothetical protein